MTNKKAYKKIDNLCCLNATRYQKDFFKDYDETDEDFCKDTYEMIDCLETIKQSLDKLEKLEKVIEILKKEGLIIRTDESDKDLPYLVMALPLEDKVIIFYETFDKNKISLLKEVFENA